ncbi:MAG: hypothetical protein ACXW2U_15395 [Telluria sp.]
MIKLPMTLAAVHLALASALTYLLVATEVLHGTGAAAFLIH